MNSKMMEQANFTIKTVVEIGNSRKVFCEKGRTSTADMQRRFRVSTMKLNAFIFETLDSYEIARRFDDDERPKNA